MIDLCTSRRRHQPVRNTFLVVLLYGIVCLMAFLLFLPPQSSLINKKQTENRILNVPHRGQGPWDTQVQAIVDENPFDCQGKEHFLRILLSSVTTPDRNATRASNEEDILVQTILQTPILSGNDTVAHTEQRRQLCRRLPTLKQVQERYGTSLRILGLETCSIYREKLHTYASNDTKVQPMPRVAGLYHTGTNALTHSFQLNLQPLPKIAINDVSTNISPHQVPWGKHVHPGHRRTHDIRLPPVDDLSLVMPIVIIRDPYFWMQSMCKSPYTVYWKRAESNRCPNLVISATNELLSKYPLTYNVHVFPQNATRKDNYTSLADMWSDWYRAYWDADYPRLIVRFEDVLFYMEDVVETVRQCVYGEEAVHATKGFRYDLLGDLKKHGLPTSYIDSLQKYLTDDNRHVGLTIQDRQYAQQVALDSELMNYFGYPYAPLKVPDSDIRGPFPDWHLPQHRREKPDVTFQ